MSWRDNFREYARARMEGFKGRYRGEGDRGSVSAILYTVLVFLSLVAIAVFDFVFYAIPPLSISGLAIITVFTLTFLYLVSRPPTYFGTFIIWLVSLFFIFVVAPWVVFVSPLAPTFKNYYNIAVEGLSVVGAFAEGFGQLMARSNACFRDATSPECVSATTLPVVIKNFGIEIVSAETQIAIADSKTTILISLQSKGERDGYLDSVVVYGNASNDCEGWNCVQKVTDIKCQNCVTALSADGKFVPAEKIVPRDSRDIIVTVQVPCNKNQKTYPFNVSIDYAYPLDASLPIDVMSKNEYESKLRAGEFRAFVDTERSGGPVFASITFGSQGLQPIKAESGATATIRLSNSQKGRFKLKSAKINFPQEFGVSDCTLADKTLTLPDITGDDRWYKDSDMIIRCAAQVPKIEEQTKRYVATVSSEYYYQISKYGEILIDTASIEAKCGSTTTTTVATTTTSTKS